MWRRVAKWLRAHRSPSTDCPYCGTAVGLRGALEIHSFMLCPHAPEEAKEWAWHPGVAKWNGRRHVVLMKDGTEAEKSIIREFALRHFVRNRRGEVRATDGG